jgi:hypothetical protein
VTGESEHQLDGVIAKDVYTRHEYVARRNRTKRHFPYNSPCTCRGTIAFEATVKLAYFSQLAEGESTSWQMFSDVMSWD